MKLLPSIITVLLLSLFGGVLVVSAQGYYPLVSLPGVTVATSTGVAAEEVVLSDYLSGIIKLTIAVAAVLAILMIVIGGTQYVAASINPSAKGDARERIEKALIGLTIVLTSYLLLNTINPKLVDFKLTLPAVKAPLVSTSNFGDDWGDDSAVRIRLFSQGIGLMRIKGPPCDTVGQQDCTSAYQLSESAISGIEKLYYHCVATWSVLLVHSCSLVVSGGTEYWLHGDKTTDINSNKTFHKPGGSVVDISKVQSGSDLAKTIQSGVNLGKQDSCSSLGVAYKLNGTIYVDEGTHWHVCY